MVFTGLRQKSTMGVFLSVIHLHNDITSILLKLKEEGKPQKKNIVVRPLGPDPPTTLELSCHPFFGTFLELQKKLFFHSGLALTTPPPFIGLTSKKITYLRLPETARGICTHGHNKDIFLFGWDTCDFKL